MPETIRIDINEAPRFTLPDGSTCYGDSDAETLYDPERDIVYICQCPQCKNIVKPDEMNCPRCGADLLRKPITDKSKAFKKDKFYLSKDDEEIKNSGAV